MLAPSPSLADDPRFPAAFAQALRKHGLDDFLGEPVRQLVTGQLDPRSLACCNSGCHPCVKDYLGAAELVLKTLGKRPRKKVFGIF